MIAAAFGFVSVIVRTEVAFVATVVGLNAFAIVGCALPGCHSTPPASASVRLLGFFHR